MIKENLYDNELYHRGTFSNCCGSNYIAGGGERRWKNQYGEGVIKRAAGDPIKDNYYGICLSAGHIGTEGAYDKGTVYHIKTKNGNITLGVRERF